MYKLFLYSVLMILYLILAKTLSPSEKGVYFLQNEKNFGEIIEETPSSVILIDTHSSGFFIKTYYQRYRVISGYDSVEDLVVRTNFDFAQKNLRNIGLSIYRRTDSGEEFTPLPPGSLYIGDREFGSWIRTKSGKTYWKFNKTFKNFPAYLGWQGFRPDQEFYQSIKAHNEKGERFLGPKEEFGPDGTVTKENFPHYFNELELNYSHSNPFWEDYFRVNF